MNTLNTQSIKNTKTTYRKLFTKLKSAQILYLVSGYKTKISLHLSKGNFVI